MNRLARSPVASVSGLLATSLLFAPGVAAQTGSITGRVLDAGSSETIPSAQVYFAALDIGVLSQQNGSYTLVNVPVGNRALTVQRTGYSPVTLSVTIAEGQTAVVDFRLREQAVQPDAAGPPGK